eukprot:3189266-Pyramimonas_sp.AAC.1
MIFAPSRPRAAPLEKGNLPRPRPRRAKRNDLPVPTLMFPWAPRPPKPRCVYGLRLGANTKHERH